MASAIEVSGLVRQGKTDGHVKGITIGLSPNQIFVSSEGTILTPFGVDLQKISILAEILLHPEKNQITEARCGEIVDELGKVCKKIGIGEDQPLITLAAQFKTLVKQRDDTFAQK